MIGSQTACRQVAVEEDRCRGPREGTGTVAKPGGLDTGIYERRPGWTQGKKKYFEKYEQIFVIIF